MAYDADASTLLPFPADRVLWARAALDQVCVTHRGQTVVYEDPEALHAAVLEAAGLTGYARRFEALERRAEALAKDAARLREDRYHALRRNAVRTRRLWRAFQATLSGGLLLMLGAAGLRLLALAL